MTMLLLVAVLWGVVTGIVPSWAWLSLSAIIALSPDRSLWWRVMIVVVVGELLLPMRVGELSLPLVASFGLVVVARRSMADVGMDEEESGTREGDQADLFHMMLRRKKMEAENNAAICEDKGDSIDKIPEYY